jgi:hypothetical protein
LPWVLTRRCSPFAEPSAISRVNPVEARCQDRGRYVAAVLTISAYLAAGCRDECPALASFEGW